MFLNEELMNTGMGFDWRPQAQDLIGKAQSMNTHVNSVVRLH